ncbi:hypothetical protein N9K16_00720 [Alphaproteobacteria bacterium]|jgi:hypothetical protein|nr:hypothetical protein [Alphaproteobacteria bacterium]
MPHAELKYSSDLDFDAQAIFVAIEDTINARDPNAGECKCRAYPTDVYHHSHILISVSLLPKAHRDDAFTAALIKELESAIKVHLKQTCYFSLLVEYSLKTYITNQHVAG